MTRRDRRGRTANDMWRDVKAGAAIALGIYAVAIIATYVWRYAL